MTVAELRAALAGMEQKWSAEDRAILGEFKDQHVCVDVFAKDGTYRGIGTPETTYYDACFGVILMAAEP